MRNNLARAVTDEVEKAGGFSNVSHGGKHFKNQIVAPNGRRGLVTTSATPSDSFHSEDQVRADARRMLRALLAEDVPVDAEPDADPVQDSTERMRQAPHAPRNRDRRLIVPVRLGAEPTRVAKRRRETTPIDPVVRFKATLRAFEGYSMKRLRKAVTYRNGNLVAYYGERLAMWIARTPPLGPYRKVLLDGLRATTKSSPDEDMALDLFIDVLNRIERKAYAVAATLPGQEQSKIAEEVENLIRKGDNEGKPFRELCQE